MGFSFSSQGVVLIVVAVSLLAVCQAKTVVVGGSQGWRFGFNYTDWTLKNGPYYIKDTLGKSTGRIAPIKPVTYIPQLSCVRENSSYSQCVIYFPFFWCAVFKYSAPSNAGAHDVYLLPDLWSYITCDFRRAKLVAKATQGGGQGFKFVLNQWRPHYFACGQGANRSHCKQGMMKFFAVPWPHWQL